MKKIISSFSAALIIAVAMFATSCNNKGDNKCALNSLDGTAWVSSDNNTVMTLSFKGNTIELKNEAPIAEYGNMTITFTGTYTYNNPDFEGTLTSVAFDVPQSIYQGLTPELKEFVEEFIDAQKERARSTLPASLPGTVSSDAQSITTKGNTSRIFNRK